MLNLFTPDPPPPSTFFDWLKKFRGDRLLALLGEPLTIRREWKLAPPSDL